MDLGVKERGVEGGMLGVSLAEGRTAVPELGWGRVRSSALDTMR